MHGSDPVRFELNRLQNQLTDKDRELGDAYAEIKALKYHQHLNEKAVEQLNDELNKVDEKLKKSESLLDTKNLELKKINDEKKQALAAQFAAEATLRRVHAAQKDDEIPPIEAIIAPLEAELKLLRMEISKLQDDNKALNRLSKSKEAALLEAERSVEIAMAKASLVDDLQNKNQELIKQIEICQEENKILDRMNRLKVSEVEKLAQTVRELEEAVLAGGAAANAVRDYERRLQEMNEEKKVLDRELARAKISANRVAAKSFPGRDATSKRKTDCCRTAKAEAQLKEKYQLRFKVLEERFKLSSRTGVSYASSERTMSTGRAPRHSKLADLGDADEKDKTKPEDFVSGMLYDMLQKEVLTLQKACLQKDQNIKDKDNTIEVLARNVETLNKAMEAESKRTRREFNAMEKELAALRAGKQRESHMGRRTSVTRTRMMA
nr:microtubule-associated protein 70-2-like [Tanacetum cinerariifolium]